MIVSAYKSKIAVNPNITIRELRVMLSNELGIGETTIFNTINEYRTTKTVSSPNKKRTCKNITTKINDIYKEAIRKKVQQFWINRKLPTVNEIHVAINNDESLPNFSRTTLFRVLKSLGFEYVNRGQNSALIDSNDLILGRRRYLRDLKKYRAEGCPIYYLGETCVNARDVSSKVCIDTTVQSSQTPFSTGLPTGTVNSSATDKRLIVVHIGSKDGFVQGGLLCFESEKNTQDYHDEINENSFRDWFASILPRLKKNAVIILDNARYHSVKVEECPTENWRKTDIIGWLKSKGEVIDPSMVIPELLEITKRLKPLYDKFVIDIIAHQYDKKVLRLPHYHSELNPIGMAWPVVKNHMKSSNKTCKLSDVQNRLLEGVEKVTKKMWTKFIEHTEKVEEQFWNLDMIVDELMAAEQEPIVLKMEDSDDNLLDSE